MPYAEMVIEQELVVRCQGGGSCREIICHVEQVERVGVMELGCGRNVKMLCKFTEAIEIYHCDLRGNLIKCLSNE